VTERISADLQFAMDTEFRQNLISAYTKLSLSYWDVSRQELRERSAHISQKSSRILIILTMA
jgi:hypothetical protein